MKEMWTAHWLPAPWADALAKRLLEFVLSVGGVWLLLRWLEAVTGGPGASSPDSLTPRSDALLWASITALFFLLRATYRLIVHPIRAAITGRFLHEEAVAGIPENRGVPESDTVEQVYPLRLGTLVGKSVGYAVGVLIVGALIYAFAQRESWGVCIFFGVIAIILAVLMADAMSKLPRKRRISVGISHAGLRIPAHKVTVPWDDVERIVLYFSVTVGGQAAVGVRVLGGGEPYVVVFRRSGDMKQLLGPTARMYVFAMADEMAGGREGYCQLARELVEWGAVKGVRVSSYTDVEWWSREALGNPIIAHPQELDPEFRTPGPPAPPNAYVGDARWGCELCYKDLGQHTRNAITLEGKAAHDYLLIYRCRACDAWYRLDVSDRYGRIDDEEAQTWLTKIAEGL